MNANYPGGLRRGADRRARRAGRPGRGGPRARAGDLPRVRGARDPHRCRSGRPRRRVARAQGRVRGDGAHQPGLLRAGRRRAAHEAARGAAPHRRARRSTACASATCSMPATATCTRSCSTTDASRARPARAEELSKKILVACIDAGGSITGEHGVGTDKACAMPLMFSEVDIATMQRLRRAFDPHGLANPGSSSRRRGSAARCPGRIARTHSRRPGLQTVSEIVEHEPGDLTCIVEGGHPAVGAA